MNLAEVSGIAADYAMRHGCPVQDVPADSINAVMEKNPYLDGTQPDILLDEQQMERSAGWKTVKSNRGYGPSYLEIPSAKPSEWVNYSVTVPCKGDYKVYSYINLSDGCAPIHHFLCEGEGLSRDVVIDARNMTLTGQTKGEWACLGTFPLDSAFTITLRPGELSPDKNHSSKPFRADAVLLVLSQNRSDENTDDE